MCMEDIRIGRETIAQELNLTVGVTAVNIIPASADRVGLIISSGAVNSIVLGFEQSLTTAFGIRLGALALPLMLNLRDHGEVVRKSIWAIASGAGTTFTVWQIFLRKD